MYGEPKAEDLIRALEGYIEGIAPRLSGHDAFLARVAVNVAAIVRRELTEGPAAAADERAALAAFAPNAGPDLDALRRAVCAEIDAGRLRLDTPNLADALLAIAAARVRIEQPKYASLARIS
jgi:hypothetical protein